MSVAKPNRNCKTHEDAELLFEIMPDGHHHYGRWICGVCSKFITWAQKPKTSQNLEYRKTVIIEQMMKEKEPDNMRKLAMLFDKVHLSVFDEIWLEKFGINVKSGPL